MIPSQKLFRLWTPEEDAQLEPYVDGGATGDVLKALANRLGRGIEATRSRIDRLRCVSRGITAWKPRQDSKPQPPAGPVIQRRCLGCRTGFATTHRFTRLCQTCTRSIRENGMVAL